jgi:hypothetical protein
MTLRFLSHLHTADPDQQAWVGASRAILDENLGHALQVTQLSTRARHAVQVGLGVSGSGAVSAGGVV